ncbi:hypothetical protein [Haloplanus rubicundus]|uniref:Uncharacterized protein n=1 Tax=Haloplanus rubicundus TaxID=1547898 RepID=A0A345EBA9_9EURY|nr:hypothetical protein [Haloplanus rubicundus]AXG09481.1 hypothetical protein DU484_06145 [Haloplanus rubicundus]
MQNAIWDATTGQPQHTGQVHTMTGGSAGGQGCGCAGCCSSSTTSGGNQAANIDNDVSVTGGTVTDTIQSLAAPGTLSTEDALLIWTALNTAILAYWAYTEVRR